MNILRLLLSLLLLTGFAHASELGEQLKTKDHVLLMRHALAPGVGDPPWYSLERCQTQRLLDDEGQRQAVRIGQWLKLQGVDQARVHTSIWCRCQKTAELLSLGPVVVEPSLASFFDEPDKAAETTKKLQAFIAQALQSKGHRALVLVTHHVNIQAFMGQNIGSGDMVLARVNAQGQMLGYRVYPSP